MDDHVESWGGVNFNKILVLDYPDPNLRCTGTTDAAAAGKVNDFLYPLLVQSKYFLDGTVDGHVTFKSDATAGRTATGYTVSLKKLNITGTTTTLGTMSFTFPVVYTFTANGYLTVPIYMMLTKQPVNENEKLVLSVQLLTTMTVNQILLSHANDSSVPDIKIRIPYAPTG